MSGAPSSSPSSSGAARSPNQLQWRRSQRLRDLGRGIISKENDLYEAPQTIVDQAFSLVINGSKELVGAILEGKSRALDKLTRQKRARSLLGKARRGLRNRTLYTIDGTINTAASLVPATLNVADNLIGNVSDLGTNIVRKLQGKNAERSSKFFLKSAAQSLVDTIGKEALLNLVIKGVLAGKHRDEALFRLKNKDYLTNTGHFTYLSDRYYALMTKPARSHSRPTRAIPQPNATHRAAA